MTNLNFARFDAAPKGSEPQATAAIRLPSAATSSAEGRPSHLPVLKRPRTRGECSAIARPCPFTSCRFSLGAGTPAHASCTLDLADGGGLTLDQLAEVMHEDREKVRRLEESGLRKVYRAMRQEWRGHAEVDVRMIVYRAWRDR